VYGLEQPFGNLIGAAGYGYLIAKVAATGVVMIWNFAVNRFWTFGDVE
jgi:putative flippase GtrA